MNAQLDVPRSTTAVSDDDALLLLERLVRIPSLSGEETAAVRFLVNTMRDLGFDATVDAAGNAVGVIGSGRPETVLLGHIDTVGGDVTVRFADGCLFGRGTVDAKGPLAAFVAAAARLGLGGIARGRIVVVGCVEEEAPSSRGAHHAVLQYVPDFCIVGEPSGARRVTLGYKGALRLCCRAEGSVGHSAHARSTAAERVVAVWQHIQSFAATFNADRHRAFDQLQPSLLNVNSGSDGLREWALAEISLRLPLALAPEQVTAAIRGFDPEVEIDVRGGVPAFQADRNTPLARYFTAAIRRQGEQPAFVVKTGTADMNLAGPAWRCPIVAYGPGDAALDHTPDEHIEAAEYLSGIRVLEDVLAQLHGAG